MEVSILGGGTIVTTIRTIYASLLHFPPRPSPDPVLAHRARPCFYTQVSHITDERVIVFVEGGLGGGERSVMSASVDGYYLTRTYFSTQTSSSRLCTHRLRVIQHIGAWTKPCRC